MHPFGERGTALLKTSFDRSVACSEMDLCGSDLLTANVTHTHTQRGPKAGCGRCLCSAQCYQSSGPQFHICIAQSSQSALAQ